MESSPSAQSRIVDFDQDVRWIYNLWDWSVFNLYFQGSLEDDGFHRVLRHGGGWICMLFESMGFQDFVYSIFRVSDMIQRDFAKLFN